MLIDVHAVDKDVRARQLYVRLKALGWTADRWMAMALALAVIETGGDVAGAEVVLAKMAGKLGCSLPVMNDEGDTHGK